MIPKSRFTLIVGLVSLALAGCQRGAEETPSNPRPPAEAPPPPPAPNLPPPEGGEAEDQAAAGGAEQAPADGGEQAAGGISPEAQAEADQLWNTLCSTCHGMGGEGDGPVAASFPVKPRSFTDKQWQAETTDESIAKVIVEGGAAIGKSPLMPGNPQLTGKPEVVEALVQKVRSFGK